MKWCRKDSTSFSWSVSDSVSEVRLVSEWSFVLTMCAMSAYSFSESFFFFLPSDGNVLLKQHRSFCSWLEWCHRGLSGERESQIQAWQPLVCGLLKFCRGFGIEQNDSDFVEILLLFFFCSIVILAFEGDLLISILQELLAFQWRWPRDLFQTNKWSF